MLERHPRLKDILGTMFTGLVGTIIVLVIEYAFLYYRLNNDVSFIVANTTSSIISTFILNMWYHKRFSVKRMIFNLACVWVAVWVGLRLSELINIGAQTHELETLLKQMIIGLIQFVIGLLFNILSYRKMGQLDRK